MRLVFWHCWQLCCLWATTCGTVPAQKKAADGVLTQLEESIGPRTIYPGDAAEPTADAEMPVATIDGYDYIGSLSIPSIGLALPVMQQWSYPGLKITPGRSRAQRFCNQPRSRRWRSKRPKTTGI